MGLPQVLREQAAVRGGVDPRVRGEPHALHEGLGRARGEHVREPDPDVLRDPEVEQHRRGGVEHRAVGADPLPEELLAEPDTALLRGGDALRIEAWAAAVHEHAGHHGAGRGAHDRRLPGPLVEPEDPLAETQVHAAGLPELGEPRAVLVDAAHPAVRDAPLVAPHLHAVRADDPFVPRGGRQPGGGIAVGAPEAPGAVVRIGRALVEQQDRPVPAGPDQRCGEGEPGCAGAEDHHGLPGAQQRGVDGLDQALGHDCRRLHQHTLLRIGRSMLRLAGPR